MREFKLIGNSHDGCYLIRVEGELDLTVCEALLDAIGKAEDSELVALDLSECDFIDSSGIAAFVRAAAELREEGREFQLRNPRGDVARVLAITGIDTDLVKDGDGGHS
jgi:anti-sigma B factor antagonist